MDPKCLRFFSVVQECAARPHAYYFSGPCCLVKTLVRQVSEVSRKMQQELNGFTRRVQEQWNPPLLDHFIAKRWEVNELRCGSQVASLFDTLQHIFDPRLDEDGEVIEAPSTEKDISILQQLKNHLQKLSMCLLCSLSLGSLCQGAKQTTRKAKDAFNVKSVWQLKCFTESKIPTKLHI